MDELEAEFQRIGPDRVIAFVAETVVGATAGALPPTPGYFKGVRELCSRHGILLIADEVMCGMGRTGTLHAVEQEGIVADLLTLAKGLGGGYQPIGAVLASRQVVEPIRQGSGLFRHGHTYIGHSMAAAAALAVQQVIQRDGLLPQVQRRGEYLMAALRQRLGRHPHMGDIRGRGGLLCYPMGGTIDGRLGDHVLLAPPFICSEADLDEIVELLAQAIDAAVKLAQDHP